MFSSEQNDRIADRIRSILPANAELVSCDRNEACFGNLIVKIKCGDRVHTFLTDRGEISCDNRVLWAPTIGGEGEDDTISLLVELIKNELTHTI